MKVTNYMRRDIAAITAELTKADLSPSRITELTVRMIKLMEELQNETNWRLNHEAQEVPA
jgi:hypothetical protein